MRVKQTAPLHPGEILLDRFLLARSETVSCLARTINEPVGLLTAIISGKARITEPLALKLAQHYGAAASYWLNLQSQFDRWAEAA
jgi:addiction module HigA family antidote